MSHPRHLVAAGLLLRSPAGRFLAVQTFNRIGDGLILPGGLVEAGESPAAAAVREVAEELGLDVAADRLLAVEHQAAAGGHPASLQFIFAMEERVAEHAELTLQPDEIAAARWVDSTAVVQQHAAVARPRMEAALGALSTGIPVYLET